MLEIYGKMIMVEVFFFVSEILVDLFVILLFYIYWNKCEVYISSLYFWLWRVFFFVGNFVSNGRIVYDIGGI